MSQSDIDKDATGFLAVGLGHMADVPVSAFVLHQWHQNRLTEEKQCRSLSRYLADLELVNGDMWFDHQHPEYPELMEPIPPDPLPSDSLLPFHYDTDYHRWSSAGARRWKTRTISAKT